MFIVSIFAVQSSPCWWPNGWQKSAQGFQADSSWTQDGGNICTKVENSRFDSDFARSTIQDQWNMPVQISQRVLGCCGTHMHKTVGTRCGNGRFHRTNERKGNRMAWHTHCHS